MRRGPVVGRGNTLSSPTQFWALVWVAQQHFAPATSPPLRRLFPESTRFLNHQWLICSLRVVYRRDRETVRGTFSA